MKLPYLIRILTITILFIIIFGLLISFIEPQTFSSIFDGIWWAIITVSTVGYGDLVPETIFGKIIAILLILLGVGFVSTFLVTLASSTISKQTSYIEGNIMFKGTNHIVIIGWNERSREVIEKLKKKQERELILLIDETLEKNPYPKGEIFFIKGQASKDKTLLQGNIQEAKKVMITADQSKDENQADMSSIVTLLAIKGLNQDVPCIIELLTREQGENAKRAGADEIIYSNGITSSVMFNCLNHTGTLESLTNFLEEFEGKRMLYQTAASYIDSTFLEANNELLSKGFLLLGIKRGRETFINPSPNMKIKTNDQLIVIAPSDK